MQKDSSAVNKQMNFRICHACTVIPGIPENNP